VEGQLSRVIEGLFQEASEHIVIFNCVGKIQFMNDKVIETLQQFNIQSSFVELTEKSNEKWHSFVQSVTQDISARSTFYLYDSYNQKVAIEMSGYYIKEKRLIYTRIRFTELPNKLTNVQRETHLINSMPHGVVLASLKGKIISSNSQSLLLLGFEVGQLEKRNYELLFEHCYYEPGAIIHYYRSIANNELATILVKRICSDGHVSYLNISSKIDDALGMLITTITDQTEKMMLLETVNHQKSLSIVGQNVASIVHEIRNPMTSIQGFIQMIKENVEEQVSPYFQIVENELQRMEEMLADLLTISKPKKYDVHLLDLKEVVEQAITLLQLKALEMNASIIFEYDETASYVIKGNENRLKQMLINLLKNAIEALEPNGHIFVHLAYQDATTLRLIVKDRGKGMSPEQLQKAFQTFYSTKTTGTGLGLLLVQAVVEEHNGVMMVDSKEGVGSSFIIDFAVKTNGYNQVTTANPLYLSQNQENYL
jgi:two-component system, sporulation sensor kinase E